MLVPAFLLGSFEKLLNYVMFTDTLTLAVVASTLFVLRRRHTGDGGFSMWGYPFLPVVYIACLLGIARGSSAWNRVLALRVIVILLTGWPLFRLGHRLFGGSPPHEPRARGATDSGAAASFAAACGARWRRTPAAPRDAAAQDRWPHRGSAA
jgi:amino acid transporter